MKNENGVQTHIIVETCDVDEIFEPRKAIKSVESLKKTRNVKETPMVDVKTTTHDASKFLESEDAEFNWLKQKLKAAHTNPQDILQIVNNIPEKDIHGWLSGD